MEDSQDKEDHEDGKDSGAEEEKKAPPGKVEDDQGQE